jgi:DNA-binding NarL/FixJ family response regulator
MIRVLLADDRAVLRAGLGRLLSEVPDIDVVLEVASGFEAVDAVRRGGVDIALVDISMPGPGVISTVEQIRAASPGTRVVVLSTHPAEQYALRVLQAGASAYVMKQDPWTEVVAAIRKAHAGGRYVTPALAETIALGLGPSKAGQQRLSDREMQVLHRITAGLAPAEIAGQLNVSPKTVHTFRARLLKKLGLRTNADLIRYGLEHHFTE